MSEDNTFSSQDIIRICSNNLTSYEFYQVQKYFAKILQIEGVFAYDKAISEAIELLLQIVGMVLNFAALSPEGLAVQIVLRQLDKVIDLMLKL